MVERERERERENVIDCFVSRDSLERRAVIKVNRVFLFFFVMLGVVSCKPL